MLILFDSNRFLTLTACSKGKDTLWKFSFRTSNEIQFQKHFMKYEMISWNTFALVSKFHCLCFSLIKKCVNREKISSDNENLIALNLDK